MSNSVFQNVIVRLKEIPGYTFGVIDTEGTVVSWHRCRPVGGTVG